MALDDNRSEALDGKPVLALDVIDGLPSGLPSELAGELADLLEDAERYAAAAQDQRVLAGYIHAGRGKDDVANVL
jgi:hypothetical protein